MTGGKPDWVVDGLNLDRPNPARMYDYLLGGHHNFAADRAAAEKVIEHLPYLKKGAIVHRAFVRRVIDLFTSEGIDQFLDIGSGLPTVGNVHDLARATVPDARVVYVDVDPVVIAHSSKLLEDDPLATIIEGDIRYPLSILQHPEVVEMLEFHRPVGLTMTSVLHYVEDDDLAYGAARALIDALASGSLVAISHGVLREHTQDVVREASDSYKAAASTKARWRDGILKFFEGLEILEPGLVSTASWRPEGPDDLMLDQAEISNFLVGVGRKP